MGTLSDRQIRHRLGIDNVTADGRELIPIPRDHPNRLEVEPFAEMTREPGHPSYGLSAYGIDLRAGRQWMYLDPYELAARGNRPLRPGDKGLPWVTKEAGPGELIIVPPRSAILAQTMERVRIPRDCWGFVLGKSTWARLFVDLNTTMIEPEWCMSEDTEILTADGWRLLAEVAVGDSVMTRRSDGVAEYQPVQVKQAHEYNGQLVHFDGKSVDQLVTPDHELFVRYRTQSGLSEGRKVRAADVYGRHNYAFDRAVKWGGPEPETIHVAGRSWRAGDFLEFYGSWLGDGSAYHGTDGGYHVKLAVVTKEEKRRRFRDVLERLGVRFSTIDRGFRFYDKDLCLWLREHGHARSKSINRAMLGFGPGLLSRLLDGLMQSDGCALTETYTTVSRNLADDFQELAFKCGQSCIVRTEDYERFGVRGQRYIMRLSREQMYPMMVPKNHRLTPYQGMVYDVTVPNHVFLSRRNGKVSWTGNCGFITLEVTNNGAAAVGIEPGEGICQLVLLRGDRPELWPLGKSYADRTDTAYQGQTGVTPPRT